MSILKKIDILSFSIPECLNNIGNHIEQYFHRQQKTFVQLFVRLQYYYDFNRSQKQPQQNVFTKLKTTINIIHIFIKENDE